MKHIKLINKGKEDYLEGSLKACGIFAVDICGVDGDACGMGSRDCCAVSDGGDCGAFAFDCTDNDGYA